MIKSKEEVEKEFDEKFCKVPTQKIGLVEELMWKEESYYGCYQEDIIEDSIKSFINQIREQDRKDLIAEIESGLPYSKMKDLTDSVMAIDTANGFNQCLSEVKELLKKYEM